MFAYFILNLFNHSHPILIKIKVMRLNFQIMFLENHILNGEGSYKVGPYFNTLFQINSEVLNIVILLNNLSKIYFV